MATPLPDIDLHDRFEDRWRVAERVIFLIMGLLVVLGVAGLLGGGPLSRAHGRIPGLNVEVDYERIVRARAKTQITLQPNASLPSPSVPVSIDADYLSAAQVQATSPTPVAQRTTKDGVDYAFLVDPARPGRMVFMLQPANPGVFKAAISVAGQRFQFTQVVLP